MMMTALSHSPRVALSRPSLAIAPTPDTPEPDGVELSHTQKVEKTDWNAGQLKSELTGELRALSTS